MRTALLVCLGLVGCSTLSEPPLPKQPDAPTAPAIVQIVGDQQDKADGRVAAAVAVARENATRPEVVKAETGVALSYLPNPSEGDLAVARARAAKSDQKDYAEAVAYGKKLLASIDTNWAKMEADTAEAKRVSQLKDTRIVELQKEIVRVKQEASRNIWTLTGAGLVVLGGLACAFASVKIGTPLLLVGGFAGSLPYIYDTQWFSWLAGATIVGVVLVGVWHLHDITHTPPPPKDDAPPTA